MVRSRVAVVALAALAAGCLDNQTIGPKATPSGGAMFASYIAIGTSISAGVQSAGLDDSTQRAAYPYLLAQAMGLTPNANWFYPGFNAPGCPPPYTNPLTGDRVGGVNDSAGGSTLCALINPTKEPPRQNWYNNLGVPSMKVGQALNILSVPDPRTDYLPAAQFITGGRSPLAILQEANPTFVTVELGANDALHAATSGDTTELTPLAVFNRQYDSLAAALVATGARVVLANVPNVDNIPFLTKGQVFFCLNSGACPGIPATPPFNSPLFTVNASCAPSAFGGVGDSMGVGLPATGAIVQTLAAGVAGGGATLNCGAATATIGAAATPVGPLVSKLAFRVISQRVESFDSTIASVATAHGWPLVNLDSALSVLVAADSIPPIPNFTNPPKLFGTFISLDGFHPASAAHKLIADLFVGAIDAKYGATLTPP